LKFALAINIKRNRNKTENIGKAFAIIVRIIIPRKIMQRMIL